jgi:hypothetical protein
LRRVVNVSGDGADGRAAPSRPGDASAESSVTRRSRTAARERSAAAGSTVDAPAIEAGEPTLGAEPAGERVTGQGPLVMAVHGMADAAMAIREKPLREIPLPVRAEAGGA